MSAAPRCPDHHSTRYQAGCEPCRRYGRWYYNMREMRRARLGPLLLDATGTQRRLLALYRMGWDWRQIGDRLGMDNRNVATLATVRRQVTARRARQVAIVYDELSMTPGPSTRAVRHAERMGWPPPLAWDDDTIDDPDATPDLGAVDNDWLPDLVWLIRDGCSWDEITRRLHRSREAIETHCVRHGCTDLLAPLRRTA